MIQLSFRHWIVVTVVMALCAAASLYYTREDNRTYPVVAIVQLNGVTPFVVSQTYNALGTANPKFPQQNVSGMLQVDSIIGTRNFYFKAHDLIDMMADSTVDMIDWKDKIARNDSMQLHVDDMLALSFRTKHPADVPILQEAVLNYLNSQPTFQAPYKAYKTGLQRSTAFHRSQVEKLDSLTTRFYFDGTYQSELLVNNGTKLMLGGRSIQLFLGEIFWEMGLMSHTENRLAVCSAPVVLLQPFTILSAVNTPLKCLVIALVLGWLLSLAIGWLIENRRTLSDWLRK